MSTNSQIIADALELIGVLSEGETPSADHGSHALRKLNQMMASWEADGTVLGYFQQSSTSDTCPIPDWAELGVYGKLALELAPFYGKPITGEIARVADAGYSLILRRLMSLAMKGADMTHLGAGSGVYDIETDAI